MKGHPAGFSLLCFFVLFLLFCFVLFCFVFCFVFVLFLCVCRVCVCDISTNLGGKRVGLILSGTFEWRGTLAVCDSVVPPPPIGPSCRGTQIILISSNLWNASLSEFCCCFCNQTMKKVLERAVLKLPFQDGAPIQRSILGGALEWKGTLRVPPQPGCPRVCPPWAHRSYATEYGPVLSITRIPVSEC